MVLIVVSLLLGVLLGISNKIPKKYQSLDNKIAFYGVLILLFVMGIKIGIEEDIETKISMLGFHAFLYSFITVIFSILVVFIISKVFFRGE